MKNLTKKIGFLFDLDGVIIDSENQYTKIWAQINQEFPTGIENFETRIKGSTLTKILSENYSSEEIREAVAARLHQLEKEMKYEYLPYARNFLKTLKELNLPTVLVTSSDTKKMEHLKDEIPEIFNFFNFIITGDLVKTSKPSPEGYIIAASKISCAPENCVVFEDSLQGVAAGKNANAFVVGMAGTLPGESLAPYSHIVVNSFDEIDLNFLIQELEARN